MNDAADTLSSLQSALREKEAECERLRKTADENINMAIRERDQSAVAEARYGDAEARLAQAREALRKHHNRCMNLGAVKILVEPDDWMEIDLTVEYGDSTLSAETRALLETP